jgi:hypothetical protein
MATSYTTLLGLAQPATGELGGTWGSVVNASVTQLVEDSVAGVATQSVASGNWTLSTTGAGATNEARKAILIPTGSPGVSRNIIAPSSSKAYLVINQSNAAVVLKGAATTGVTIATGANVLVAWNGSDFVSVTPSLSAYLPLAGGTMTGLLTTKELALTKTAPSISAGVLTLDCSLSNTFAVSLNAAITSFTVSNIPSSGSYYEFNLEFIADGTARAVTWTFSSVAVKWPGGTAPTLTSTNGKKDTFVFYTYDAGTTWLGFVAGQNL